MTFRSVKKPVPHFGLVGRGTHEIVPINACLLQDDLANHILRKVRRPCFAVCAKQQCSTCMDTSAAWVCM